MIEKEFNKFDYGDSIVVFLDILGFSDKIKNTKSPNGKKALFNTLSYMNAWGTTEDTNFIISENDFIYDYNQFNIGRININVIKKKLKISYFSDSIVISLEYDKNNLYKRFILVAKSLAYLISKLALANFFTRGGVTIGKMFHENNVFFGPALLNAYELELTTAIYPRVILSKELVNELNDINRKIPYIETAEDGLKYIDWINYAGMNKKDFGKEQIDKIKKIINSNIDKNSANLKVRAKYEWLKNQFQVMCEDNK